MAGYVAVKWQAYSRKNSFREPNQQLARAYHGEYAV